MKVPTVRTHMSLGKDEDLFSDLTIVDGKGQQQSNGETGSSGGERGERGFPGVDEGLLSKAVEEAVRRVVKDSLAPMIQRVLLKIDTLDSKVKQMQLVHEDVCQETGGLKKQTEELKEMMESIREEMVERFDGLHVTHDETEKDPVVDVGALEDMVEKKAPPPVQAVVQTVPPPAASMNHTASHPHVSSGVRPPPLPRGGVVAQGPPPPPAPQYLPPPPAPPPAPAPQYLPPAPPGPYHHHAPPTQHHLPPQEQYYSASNEHQNYASSVSSSGYENRMAAAPQGAASRSQPTAPTKPTSVPIEKVIDDISIMGFSREEVRNVLRELTAQGKPVDMNIVLDRLGAR